MCANRMEALAELIELCNNGPKSKMESTPHMLQEQGLAGGSGRTEFAEEPCCIQPELLSLCQQDPRTPGAASQLPWFRLAPPQS